MTRRGYRKAQTQTREHTAYRAARATLIALLIGILLALLFVPRARAADDAGEKFAILAAYAWVDYDQSAGGVTPGGGAVELNPLLGEHPSRRDMLAFGAAGLGLLWLASELLPAPWATIVVDSALTSEQWNIEDNVLAEQGRRRFEGIPIILTLRF